ncbi:MAG: hypothetical protein IPH89_12550 [Bacteroidetes bacterium]|nr:hypothetical protein [Bacteroidota bacterium]
MEENFQPKIIKYINLGHDIEFSSSFKKAQKELHILHFMENTTKEHIFLEFHEKYLYYFNIILRVVETYVILLQKVIFEYQEFYKDLIF